MLQKFANSLFPTDYSYMTNHSESEIKYAVNVNLYIHRKLPSNQVARLVYPHIAVLERQLYSRLSFGASCTFISQLMIPCHDI